LALLESQNSLQAVADLLLTLGEGEVIIKKNEEGSVYDVYCLEQLSPEQLDLLSRGVKPEGINRILVI
jgi:hypothetical protein